MPTPRKKAETIDAYIAAFRPEVRAKLKKLRREIREAAPEAVEAISYGIPTFKLRGNLVHFAAFKDHISFFPTASGIAAFRKELSRYPLSTGTVRFALDRPIPFALVRKIVKFRVREKKKPMATRDRSPVTGGREP